MNKEYNVVPNGQSNFDFETNTITTYPDIFLQDEFYPLYLFPKVKTSYKDYSMFCRLTMGLPVGEFYGACRQEDRNYYLMDNYSFVYLFKKWVQEGLNLQDIFPKQDMIKLSTFKDLSSEQKKNIKYAGISLSRIRIYSKDKTDTLSKIYSLYTTLSTAENKAAINLLVNDKRKEIYALCERYESVYMNSEKYFTILSPDFERYLYHDMVKDLGMTSSEFIELLKENNPEKNLMLLDKFKQCLNSNNQDNENRIEMR